MTKIFFIIVLSLTSLGVFASANIADKRIDKAYPTLKSEKGEINSLQANQSARRPPGREAYPGDVFYPKPKVGK